MDFPSQDNLTQSPAFTGRRDRDDQEDLQSLQTNVTNKTIKGNLPQPIARNPAKKKGNRDFNQKSCCSSSSEDGKNCSIF